MTNVHRQLLHEGTAQLVILRAHLNHEALEFFLELVERCVYFLVLVFCVRAPFLQFVRLLSSEVCDTFLLPPDTLASARATFGLAFRQSV